MGDTAGPRLPLVVNERGERLLAWHGANATPLATPAFALVVAITDAGVLLVRNAVRNVWELPGGWIDHGESPAQGAARELQEETGWTAHGMVLHGWIELLPAGATVVTSGAVFVAMSAVRTAVPACGENEEIAASGWWPLDALPPGMSEIDAWLIGGLAGNGGLTRSHASHRALDARTSVGHVGNDDHP